MKVSGDCGCDILSQGLQPFSLHGAFSMYVLPDEYFHHKLLSTDLEVLCNTAVTITVGTFENISHHCELSLNDVQRISFQQFCSYQIQFELLWSVFFFQTSFTDLKATSTRRREKWITDALDTVSYVINTWAMIQRRET